MTIACTIVEVLCDHCSFRFLSGYRLIGTTAPCRRCSRSTVVSVVAGAALPYTGYEITFNDFMQLVRNESSPQHLLAGWTRDLEKHRIDLTLTNTTSDWLAIHLLIQNDPEKQYELYQMAMSLWR